MNRTDRDFKARPKVEREFMLENTWCEPCERADLGMRGPHEYEEDGPVYIEGTCKACGGRVRSEITEEGAG